MAKSTMRSMPSATQYLSVSRKIPPAAPRRAAPRIGSCVSSEPRHHGVSQNGRPSTSSLVYPHASTARALTSSRLPSRSRIPAKIPDWLKTDSNFAVAARSASSARLRALTSRAILPPRRSPHVRS